MIKLLATLGLTLTPFLTQAGALDSSDRATSVKEKMEPSVLGIDGVSGIGVGACDLVTGTVTDDFDADFVHCVVIMSETEQAYLRLENLYPANSKVRGVFIALRHTGPIRPQPRGSAGN